MKKKTHSSALTTSLVVACLLSGLTVGATFAGEIDYNLEGVILSRNFDSIDAATLRVEISTNQNFSQTVSTHSGTAGSSGTADGDRNAALFSTPTGIARDTEGNIFIADTVNHRIRLIDTEGVVTTIAGSDYGFADGDGDAAQFQFPTALAVAPNGDLYVADTFNHAIRKITRPSATGAWTVSTVAGTGQAGFFDGPGVSARFNLPQGLAYDPTGIIYVADSGNHLVRKIDTNITVSTFAGTAAQAGFQDGAATTEARFDRPFGVAYDENGGNLYVADRDNKRVRKIDGGGSVTTLNEVTFNDPVALVVYGNNLYVSNKANHTIAEVILSSDRTYVSDGIIAGTPDTSGNADGDAISATFNCPSGITADSAGNLYIADAHNHVVRRIVTRGLTVVAEGDDLFHTVQVSQSSLGLETHSVSNTRPYYFRWIDESNNVVNPRTPPDSFRLFAPPLVQINAGTPVEFPSQTNATLLAQVDTRESASTVTFEYSTDPDLRGPLEVSSPVIPSVGLRNPGGIAIDSNGSIYVSDRDTHTIYKYEDTGTRIQTATGEFQVSLSGSIFAGSGTAGFVDGQGSGAQFDHPSGLAYDSSDNSIYVADEFNHCIRRISASGEVTTIAGSGIAGYEDSEDALNGKFLFPTGLAFAGDTLYIADRGNHLIRSLQASVSPGSIRNVGDLTTLAGNGVSGFVNGATDSAQFDNPTDVAISPSGAILVADRDNHCIRAIDTTNGFVSTRAGTGTAGLENGERTVSQFNSPTGLTIDASNNCYVADQGNHCIRLVDPEGTTTTYAGSGQAGYVDSSELFPATAAAFDNPRALALGEDGVDPVIYVAENGEGLLRQISRAALPSSDQINIEEGSPSISNESHAIPQILLPTATYYFRTRIVNQRSETVSEITSFTVPSTQSLSVTADINPDTPLLNDRSTVFDYGTTPLGVIISQNFTITNNGQWPLEITSINTPAGYQVTTVLTPAMTLAGGESLPFQVSMTGTPGATYEGDIQIISNDPESPSFPIPVTGVVLDPPSVTTLAGQDPTEKTVLLNAEINPNGTTTEAWFAYSLDPELDGVDVTTLTLTTEDSLPSNPSGIATDTAGNIYIADADLHRILLLSPDDDPDEWTVSIIAGDGTAGFADGDSSTAQFDHPMDLAVGDDGRIYVADRDNNRIRVISTDGSVSTLAGTGDAAFTDGDPSAARFNAPTGIAIDTAGILYVADSGNNRIRTVAEDGTTATLAGGLSGDNTTDGPALEAILITPYAVAVGTNETVYFTEMARNHIRQVSSDQVLTLAGSELAADYQDGNGTAARFSLPGRVHLNTDGSVLVADDGNNRIRLVSTSGTVTTLAGSGIAATTDGVGDTIGMLDDNGESIVTAADMLTPHSITLATDGTILVGQTSDGAIRQIASNTIILEATSADGATELTGDASIAVTALAEELTPQAQYYTRAYATNSGGTVAGDVEEFMGRLLTRFETWQVENFGDDAGTEKASANAGPDEDKVVNLMEYALLSDPLLKTSETDLTDVDTRAGRLYLEYTREIDSVYVPGQNNPNDGDLIFTIETSVDLESWAPVADTALTIQTVTLGTVVSGTFDSNTANSLTDTDVNFANVLTPGKRYLIEIIDSGTVIEVDAWSGSDLTGLSGVLAADASDYTIRAAKTQERVYASVPLNTATGPDVITQDPPRCLRLKVELVTLP